MNMNTNVTEGIKPVMTDPTRENGETAPRTKGVLLQVKGLTVRTSAGESLLSDISFHVEPSELVALTGLSRSGKSVLLQSLAGLMKPESGTILIDGVDLAPNLKAFRPTIGFVPAEYPLPQNLTVAELLEDEARLRLPRRITSRERKERVLALLQAVGLTQETGRRLGTLSNFERRKVGIAVELMAYPGLLLVDASAEPLAPFEEVEILILLKELSRQGLTIIQVNERSRSVGIADKILFLAPGGLLAWFGPGDETFAYLKGLLPRGVVKDLFGLQEALEILVKPQSGDGIEWAKRFRDHEAYQRYVDDPLHNRYPDLLLQTRPLLRLRLRNASQEKVPPRIIPRASGLQKLRLLIRRNSRLSWRDRTTLRLLAIPPLVALVTFGLSATTILGPVAGESTRSPTAFGLLMFVVVLTAAFVVQNEIAKERPIYEREHRTSPMLLPYVLSKVWLAGLLAIYQGLIWMGVLFLAIMGQTVNFEALRYYGITFCLIALIGGILGLIVSSLSRTAMPPLGWLLLLTVPQLLLILSPLGQWSGLAIMSLFLLIALVGIQRVAGAVRT
jgi:ABC transport system ATP-binding/permease protein